MYKRIINDTSSRSTFNKSTLSKEINDLRVIQNVLVEI